MNVHALGRDECLPFLCSLRGKVHPRGQGHGLTQQGHLSPVNLQAAKLEGSLMITGVNDYSRCLDLPGKNKFWKFQ